MPATVANTASATSMAAREAVPSSCSGHRFSRELVSPRGAARLVLLLLLRGTLPTELEMQLVPLLFRRQHAPIAHVQQKPCRVRTTSATVATEVELASAILPTLMVSARSSTRSSRACKRADRGCWADEKAGAEPVVPGAAAACLLL